MNKRLTAILVIEERLKDIDDFYEYELKTADAVCDGLLQRANYEDHLREMWLKQRSPFQFVLEELQKDQERAETNPGKELLKTRIRLSKLANELGIEEVKDEEDEGLMEAKDYDEYYDKNNWDRR